METVKVFDKKFQEILDDKLKSILEENEEIITEENTEWVPENSSLSCSYCRTQFVDKAQQREHYKLDWHRYNLKQSLLGKEPITEEEFNGKTEQDEISSISGSDSDEREDFATAQGRVYLQNEKGTVFSVYSCLLFDKNLFFIRTNPLLTKDNAVNEDLLQKNLINCCRDNKKWTILMLGGGHFAGAVFDGETPIIHKTFHCYTVRAGQGGSQSAKDNKSGSGSHPKSAGASLRRYNEQSLVQHVRSILENWKNEIKDSSLIFYRAAGPYNKGVLFGGGSGAILNKNDPRLRTIPFSTRRATFTELKRVHNVLITANIYESKEIALEKFTKAKQPETNRKTNFDRAKTREIVERPLPSSLVHESSSSSSSEDENGMDLVAEDNSISFQNLEQFGDSLKPHQRKKKVRKSKTQKLKEQEEARKKEILNCLIRGDNEKLIELLEKNIFEINENLENGNTALHLAAMNEHGTTVNLLLEKNADPCIKNDKQKTPYTSTQSKEIREILKQFARENPEKFNYNKAQIPVNTATPEEIAEKKKAQKKIKKEKEKIKKQENAIKQKEEQEKERFLKLSDREKRALAAERRILNQSGKVIIRCFFCAIDITGKVPFEYMGNRFCSINCLKQHRMQNAESIPEI